MREFRTSNILVRSDACIDSPEQLTGRLIGVPEYQMTAVVWQRGILEDEYGVSPESIQWVYGGEEKSGRKMEARERKTRLWHKQMSCKKRNRGMKVTK